MSAPAAPTSPWQYPDFRLLAFSRAFGTLGIQMLAVAIGWQVYDLTHSAFAIGFVGFCQFAPSVLLVLHAGHLADQLDRGRILGLAHLLAGVAAAVLMAATFFSAVSPYLIYAMAVLLGVMRIFGAPAGQALLPNIVPKEVFSSGVALNSMAFQLATILGPALAGGMFFFGTVAVYAAALLMLAIGGISALLIRTRTRGEKRPMNTENLWAGMKFIFARPIMLGAISLDLFAVLFGGVVALLPIYARDILHIGPQGLGLLRSAPAMGAALMSLYLSRYAIKNRAGFWLLASVVVFGVATILFGFSMNPLFAMGMLLILGGADMVSVYVRSHLMQLHTPDAMRGRVASVNMLFITTSNELGDFESGLMAGWLGTVPAVVFGGVMALVITALVAWRVPRLRKLKSLARIEVEETVPPS
ncbi:MAG: MFS transporter [Proteobacteria bacterium]|nr:MFS transporter [Pseudomonadota bacterium]